LARVFAVLDSFVEEGDYSLAGLWPQLSQLLDCPFRVNGKERTAVDFPNNSSVYQEFLAEREEILRHKWLDSEKAGKDIGFDRALIDWVRNHRSEWRASRQV